MINDCTNQVCQAGMDRCYAMAYTLKFVIQLPTPVNLTRSAWQRGCNNKTFCALSDEQACAAVNKTLGAAVNKFPWVTTTMTRDNCKMACSEQNDVVIPGPEGKEYITILIMIWLTLPTLICFFCY